MQRSTVGREDLERSDGGKLRLQGGELAHALLLVAGQDRQGELARAEGEGHAEGVPGLAQHDLPAVAIGEVPVAEAEEDHEQGRAHEEPCREGPPASRFVGSVHGAEHPPSFHAPVPRRSMFHESQERNGT